MANLSTSLPLAKASQAKDLPGFLKRVLEVPVGRQGIVWQKSGKHRLLPVGRHIVFVLLPRIIHNDTGLWAGYIPTQPFVVFFDVPNLLSGDNELVDSSILCMVKVTDPLQFFHSQVIPLQEIPAEGLKLPPYLVEKNLGPLVRRYVAADLSAGLPTDYLSGQVSDLIEHQLAGQGLQLISIKMLSFIQAEDRVEIADKLQQMREKLDDVQFDARLESIRDQAQLDDLIRQLQAEMGIPAGLRPVYDQGKVAEPLSVASGQTQGNLIGNLKLWLQQHPLEQSADHARRILEMLHQDNPKAGEQVVAKEKQSLNSWIRMHALIVTGLVVGGFCLSEVILLFTDKANPESKWGFLSIVWGPILAAVAQNLVQFFQKQAEAQEIHQSVPGRTKIYELVNDNSEKVDQLVRNQIDQELVHIDEMMLDCRSKSYRSGDEAAALQFMDLHKSLEDRRERIQDLGFAKAAYNSGLKISREAMGQMLTYDEGLLVQIANHAEFAHSIQQKLTNGVSVGAELTTLASRLETFEHAFSRRARVIQLK